MIVGLLSNGFSFNNEFGIFKKIIKRKECVTKARKKINRNVGHKEVSYHLVYAQFHIDILIGWT